ncbi:MAG: MerC domain-containing protein [Bacteroidota bacterium]
MQDKFFGINLDFLGFSASLLCAIHCISLPLLLSIGALSGLAWLENELLEQGIILFSFVVASWSIGQSYFKYRIKLDAIAMVFVGFGFIFCAHFLAENLEPILMMIGGLCVAFAHYLNWKMVNRYKTLEYAAS